MSGILEVYARKLSGAESQRLWHLVRTTQDLVGQRRTRIVLSSTRGRSVAEIAEQFAVEAAYVRMVLHTFNAMGFDALDPRLEPGVRRTSY